MKTDNRTIQVPFRVRGTTPLTQGELAIIQAEIVAYMGNNRYSSPMRSVDTGAPRASVLATCQVSADPLGGVAQLVFTDPLDMGCITHIHANIGGFIDGLLWAWNYGGKFPAAK